ncbi:MAG: hypothetical protein PUC42_14295 [Bacteroidales bacterium]|jgi:uncharacterized Fe-S radical SAM superfamily protein PflX|nr:hypothetical protein [Bacteroidales bacterium]
MHTSIITDIVNVYPINFPIHLLPSIFRYICEKKSNKGGSNKYTNENIITTNKGSYIIVHLKSDQYAKHKMKTIPILNLSGVKSNNFNTLEERNIIIRHIAMPPKASDCNFLGNAEKNIGFLSLSFTMTSS